VEEDVVLTPRHDASIRIIAKNEARTGSPGGRGRRSFWDMCAQKVTSFIVMATWAQAILCHYEGGHARIYPPKRKKGEVKGEDLTKKY